MKMNQLQTLQQLVVDGKAKAVVMNNKKAVVYIVEDKEAQFNGSSLYGVWIKDEKQRPRKVNNVSVIEDGFKIERYVYDRENASDYKNMLDSILVKEDDEAVAGQPAAEEVMGEDALIAGTMAEGESVAENTEEYAEDPEFDAELEEPAFEEETEKPVETPISEETAEHSAVYSGKYVDADALNAESETELTSEEPVEEEALQGPVSEDVESVGIIDYVKYSRSIKKTNENLGVEGGEETSNSIAERLSGLKKEELDELKAKASIFEEFVSAEVDCLKVAGKDMNDESWEAAKIKFDEAERKMIDEIGGEDSEEYKYALKLAEEDFDALNKANEKTEPVVETIAEQEEQPAAEEVTEEDEVLSSNKSVKAFVKEHKKAFTIASAVVAGLIVVGHTGAALTYVDRTDDAKEYGRAEAKKVVNNYKEDDSLLKYENNIPVGGDYVFQMPEPYTNNALRGRWRQGDWTAATNFGASEVRIEEEAAPLGQAVMQELIEVDKDGKSFVKDGKLVIVYPWGFENSARDGKTAREKNIEDLVAQGMTAEQAEDYTTIYENSYMKEALDNENSPLHKAPVEAKNIDIGFISKSLNKNETEWANAIKEKTGEKNDFVSLSAADIDGEASITAKVSEDLSWILPLTKNDAGAFVDKNGSVIKEDVTSVWSVVVGAAKTPVKEEKAVYFTLDEFGAALNDNLLKDDVLAAVQAVAKTEEDLELALENKTLKATGEETIYNFTLKTNSNNQILDVNNNAIVLDAENGLGDEFMLALAANEYTTTTIGPDMTVNNVNDVVKDNSMWEQKIVDFIKKNDINNSAQNVATDNTNLVYTEGEKVIYAFANGNLYTIELADIDWNGKPLGVNASTVDMHMEQASCGIKGQNLETALKNLPENSISEDNINAIKKEFAKKYGFNDDMKIFAEVEKSGKNATVTFTFAGTKTSGGFGAVSDEVNVKNNTGSVTKSNYVVAAALFGDFEGYTTVKSESKTVMEGVVYGNKDEGRDL